MTKPRRLDYPEFLAIQSSLRTPMAKAKLPASTRQHITDLFMRMIYLMWQTSQRSPKASWYCVPSRAYLAASIHVTTRSITTFTHLLRDLGWINKAHRRNDKRGLRRTAIYAPGSRLRAALVKKVPASSKPTGSSPEATSTQERPQTPTT